MGEALDKLNMRQRAFVYAYVVGDTAGNGAASYEVAGYRARGKAAGNAASRLLENVGVQKAVAELRAETIDKAEAEKVLSAVERHEILAAIARTSESDKSKIGAIRLDAELRGDLVKRGKVEHTGPGGGPLTAAAVDPRSLPTSALQALLKARKEAADGSA